LFHIHIPFRLFELFRIMTIISQFYDRIMTVFL